MFVSCSGSGGSRTHSIPGSKPRWSAGCLPSRSSPGRTRTADCHLVRVLPLPLGYRTMFFKWSHRESHPDFRLAEPASSCWTMTPMSCQRKPWGSNPQAACLPPPAFQAGSSPIRMTSVFNFMKAEPVRLKLTNAFQPSPVFKNRLLIRPDGSIVKLRRLESNQHEDFRVSHLAVR